MGLSATQINQLGLAVGAFDEHFFGPPVFFCKNTFRGNRKKNPAVKPGHGNSPLSNLTAGIINYTPTDVGLALLIATLLFAGWNGIKFLGQRKKAFEEELTLPNFPIPVAASFILLIALCLVLTIKINDLTKVKGTIILNEQPLYSGPTETSASLFKLSEGFEVIIKKHQNDWTLITYPGGFTGWVPDETIFKHTGWYE
ncbi:MAG: SH3 domain-containing protein [Bdellovibrionales bacterium]